LAHFWETHDLADFFDELEEVNEPVFERQDVVTVRLEPQDVEIIKAIAKSRGISYRNLIQEWVIERIHILAGLRA